MNSFTVRQISSKINTTVVSMGIITLLLFFTICILSSALSIKNSMTANLTTMVPADIQIVKKVDLERKNTVTGTPYDYFLSGADRIDTRLSILESLERADPNILSNLTDIHEFYTYETKEVTLETTLGSAIEKAKRDYPYMQFHSMEEIIRISDYNRLAEFYHIPTYELNENEYILLADFDGLKTLRDEGLKANAPITIQGKTYMPKYRECQNGFIYMSQSHINSGLFVVPDDAVDELMRADNVVVANYIGTTKEEKRVIEEKFMALSDNAYFAALTQSRIDASTKIAIYEASVGLSAMITFIGLYLGIIFLISSAAILALKELSESTDNQSRFQMLRKIGTDEKMIHQALFRQIAIFFLFPLIFAIIHSIFGIQFCNYIIETFGNEKLLQSILMTAIFLIFIYVGYFLITYYCSKNIIKEKTRY